MAESKPNRRRLIIYLLFITIVVVAIVLIAIFFFGNGDDKYRVVSISNLDPSTHSVNDFRNSKLNIYDNGTFAVTIVFTNRTTGENEIRFTGIGTQERTSRGGNNYFVFNYIEAQTPNASGGMVSTFAYTNPSYPNNDGFFYRITSNNRIQFSLLDGSTFYFSR